MFNITNHNETIEGFQWISLTEFAITDRIISSNDIINAFIRLKDASFVNLLDNAEHLVPKFYLRHIFNVDQLQITSFKKTDKQGVAQFLVDFSNEPDWGDDKKDFVKLLNRYSKVHYSIYGNECYILSKDWFLTGGSILAETSWIYTYYFIIISIDRDSNTLTLTEWIYD